MASRLVFCSGAKLMMMEARQLPKLERITVSCPGAQDPKVVSEWLAKQNKTLNVSRWKLTSFKEIITEKGEVETSL